MKRVIIITSMVAVLASCDGSLKQQTASGGFSVSEKEITFYPGGETVQVMFTSGEDWSVGKPDWIILKQGDKVINNGGVAGSYNLQLRAECNVNMDYDDQIIFSSGSNIQAISVSQEQARLQIRNVRKNYYLNMAGYQNKDSFLWMESENISGYNEPLKLEIKGNVWWRIEPKQEQDYYNISKQEGEGDDFVEIIPLSPNISENSCDIHLSIVTPHQNFNRELSITQDNLTFEFNHKEIAVNELGEPKDDVDLSELTLKSEVSWSRTAKGETYNTDWKWVNLGNEGLFDPEYPSAVKLGKLEIAANENREQITHQIEFTPEIDGVDFSSIKDHFSIQVTQDPFIFDIDGNREKDCSFNNSDSLNNSQSFPINASADWLVDDCPEWVQILENTSSGSGKPGGNTSRLTIAPVGQNLNHNEDREGKVKLKNKKVGLSTVLNVSQQKFEFKPYQGNSLTFLTLPEKEDSEYKYFAMTVDGAWIIDNETDWLSFKKMSGPSSEGILYVKANSTNTEEQDRPGSFKVVSKRHKDIGEDVSFIVNVKQNGFRFDVETPTTFYEKWSPKGETKSLNIISPTQWTVMSAENCTISPTTSDSDATVYIATELNKTGDERECKVVFYNKDVNKGRGKQIPVVFTQKKYDFEVTWPESLNISGSQAFLDPLGNKEHEVNVKCSGDWEVSATKSWVGCVKKKNDTSFSITLPENFNMTTLSDGYVTVYNKDLEKTYKIRIIRDAYIYKVAPSATAPEFGPLETDKWKELAIYECSGNITYNTDNEWINLKTEGDKIFVSVDEYTGVSQRSGTVTIHNEHEVGTPVEITVTQDGYNFSISPATTSYTGISSDGITNTIKLTSSGAWEVQVSDSKMLSASPGSGASAVTNKDVKITVNKHADTDGGREGTVTFVSKDDSNRKHVVTFKQNAAPKPTE